MLTVDTRERKWSHIKKAFDDAGVQYQIHKLDFGDYRNEDRPWLVVDRKQNLNEVATNLCSKDSSRFWNELRGAYKEGIKIVILCEHGGQIHSVRDVAGWKNKYSAYMSGAQLMSRMFDTSFAYGVEWQFCRKSETARRILEILEHGR